MMKVNSDSPARPTPSESIAPQPRRREALIGIVAFTARRLAFGVLVLTAITYLSYLGLGMAQGIAFRPALARAAWKTLTYMGRLARGDLGLSAAGSITLLPKPVAEVVPATLSKSLGLLAAALLIATLVGAALGTWAAGRRHSGWSLVTLLASIAGVSVPSFFAALLLQLAMIQWARAFGHPLLPTGGFGWDKHIILPALVLAARPIAQIARITFVSLSEALEQDFVRTAHSKGLWPRQVMIGHVIRNAAIPILTTVGTSLRFSLSSLPVVEFFFGWPGLGFNLLKAISRQDDNLTVALILCLGALFILVNLTLEVGYRLIDPRLREAPAYIVQGERGNLAERVKSLLADLRDLIADNPVSNWLARRRAGPSPNPFRAVLEQNRTPFAVTQEEHRAERRRAWLRGTVGNLSFVAGGILIAILITVFAFGPRLAPHSPYTTQGLVFKDGKFSVPPFAPNETYPWGTDVLGRDIMSLILAGAQRTLFLATLVVAARMVVGFVLGALAGWLNGHWADRLLLGLAETIAAFPTLLLSMTLILALGIRQGLRPFVIALCFVGWGEIMQFVRGEVMAIRPKPFIESAMAVGLRTSRIVLSHVLPNLLPALISIAALEMGAVLMLLGELGFIGIFIGGGAFAELGWMAPLYHYSDVPEWGALLSNVRTYARTYPWTALYPALAFFVAILGFNLFGEGIRRMVERVGMGVIRLVNRYTVALVLMVVVGIGWARGNTGAMTFYRRQASAFDGQRALAHVQALADPAVDGRALGTLEMDKAAEYIAQQFQSLGLQAAGEKFTYFQTRERYFERLDAVPLFAIEDGGRPLAYHQDFAEYPGYYRTLGQAHEQIRFLAIGELTTDGWGNYPALESLNFSNEILLLLSDREARYLDRVAYQVPRGGILVVTDNPADLRRRHTLSSRDFVNPLTGEQMREDVPALWVSEATADHILRGTGRTVADLRHKAEELGVNEVFELPTGVTASMEVQGTVYKKVPVRHVIGHLPGTSSSQFGGMDDHLIVVLAQYDSPPSSPFSSPLVGGIEGGGTYPAANDNASGVAVMLEAIRTMQETGYQPYKTFLFVAYSGEGLEGGGEVSPLEVDRFLQAKQGFSTSFKVEAVVDLRGLGAGRGDGLALSAEGSLRLANLFAEAARQMGVKAYRAREPVDISIVFEEKGVLESGQEAPNVGLSWEGWEETSRTPSDTLEGISADKLEQAGRALTQALMILGRETQY
jgi:peptide/nickel transport system permease protein